MLCKDVQLRTRRTLLLYTNNVYGDSTLLVLNETSFKALTPFWLSADEMLHLLIKLKVQMKLGILAVEHFCAA